MGVKVVLRSRLSRHLRQTRDRFAGSGIMNAVEAGEKSTFSKSGVAKGAAERDDGINLDGGTE